MVNLRDDVYRRLRKLKRGRSFSVVVDELIDQNTTNDGDELLRRAARFRGRTGYSGRASARHKRAG